MAATLAHGKVKYHCEGCNPCPHGKLKRKCVDCNPCPHGKLKYNCRDCKSAPPAKKPKTYIVMHLLSISIV